MRHEWHKTSIISSTSCNAVARLTTPTGSIPGGMPTQPTGSAMYHSHAAPIFRWTWTKRVRWQTQSADQSRPPSIVRLHRQCQTTWTITIRRVAIRSWSRLCAGDSIILLVRFDSSVFCVWHNGPRLNHEFINTFSAILVALIMIQFTGLVATCILCCCRSAKNRLQPPYINIATHEDAHYNL